MNDLFDDEDFLLFGKLPSGYTSDVCAETGCGHSMGWHRKDVGACLECGCLEWIQTKPVLADE